MTASNAQGFKFDYDSQSGKYGYVVSEGGADTFIPFSSGGGALNFSLTKSIASNNYGASPVVFDNSNGQYTSATINITFVGNPACGLVTTMGTYNTVGTYTADVSTYSELSFSVQRITSFTGSANFACTVTLE